MNHVLRTWFIYLEERNTLEGVMNQGQGSCEHECSQTQVAKLAQTVQEVTSGTVDVAFVDPGYHKVGLLNLAAELGNVSRACKVMGFSRDTFYRYQSAMAAGGVDALIDANCKKPNLRNQVEEATESAVVAFALEQPAFGQVRHSCQGAFIGRLP
jgi:hypothetical protein